MTHPTFLDSYVKGPLFWYPCKYVYFFAQRFVTAACSLGIQWIDCYICLTTSNKWGQYMNRSTFRTIKDMNGSVFSKAMYMNGVVFEILAHTPVLHLAPNLPHPAPTSWKDSFQYMFSHFRRGCGSYSFQFLLRKTGISVLQSKCRLCSHNQANKLEKTASLTSTQR